MCIINICAKTPETLYEKHEKTTSYNVVIIPMKNSCGKKNQEIYIILYCHCLIKIYCENIMSIFSQASGLKINMDKTQFFPIRCQKTDLSFMTQHNHPTSHLLCRYLGLPCFPEANSKNCRQDGKEASLLTLGKNC
jgi:hypothetical protein